MQLRFGVIWEGPTVEDEDSQIISVNSGNSNTIIVHTVTITIVVDEQDREKEKILCTEHIPENFSEISSCVSKS
jgi:hypothetical protein